MITKKDLHDAAKELKWTVEPLKKNEKEVKGSYVVYTKRTAPVVVKITAKVLTITRMGGKDLYVGKMKSKEDLTLTFKRILL